MHFARCCLTRLPTRVYTNLNQQRLWKVAVCRGRMAIPAVATPGPIVLKYPRRRRIAVCGAMQVLATPAVAKPASIDRLRLRRIAVCGQGMAMQWLVMQVVASPPQMTCQY